MRKGISYNSRINVSSRRFQIRRKKVALGGIRL